MDPKVTIAGREFLASQSSAKEVSIRANLSDIINYDNTQEVLGDLTRVAIDMLIDQVKDQSSRDEIIETTASVSVDVNEGGHIIVDAKYEYPFEMTLSGGGHVSVSVIQHTLDEDYDDDGEIIDNDAHKLNELFQFACDELDVYRRLTEDEVHELFNHVAN
ncbi:hypothetical protein [uncultured Porphyromonas sp.]|uniref:hypothetical protein n=1 Tax=uncultured Porphyromonas sp. TaxID=159274 RepID=UPI0026355086|nr:hypothetical protein [uncultured Porphyromonas sp.]